MSDLISREALRREIYKDMAIEDNKRVVQLLQAVMDAPTVDAVPVVRCKDCVHATVFRNGQVSCGYHDWCRIQVKPDGYCYHGEMDGGADE